MTPLPDNVTINNRVTFTLGEGLDNIMAHIQKAIEAIRQKNNFVAENHINLACGYAHIMKEQL